MDYDGYAKTYASTRWAVPWITVVLGRQVERLASQATIVEIGCGTGNYVIALSSMFAECKWKGFDLSHEMLAIARSRSNRVEFVTGDADAHFPYTADEADLAYLVDVIHHLRNFESFFSECARILKPSGVLAIVTDSEANIRSRSLTRFFPEILEIELARYPKIDDLSAAAGRAGFALLRQEPAEGDITFDDAFIAKLEQKCSSAMRMISPEAHKAGMARVRAAQRAGEMWHSLYTCLTYRKVR
jgi:SAM-dependent methyltransferase